jgi:hypothetical protein
MTHVRELQAHLHSVRAAGRGRRLRVGTELGTRTFRFTLVEERVCVCRTGGGSGRQCEAFAILLAIAIALRFQCHGRRTIIIIVVVGSGVCAAINAAGPSSTLRSRSKDVAT